MNTYARTTLLLVAVVLVGCATTQEPHRELPARAPSSADERLARFGSEPFSASPRQLIDLFDTLTRDQRAGITGGLYDYEVRLDDAGRTTRIQRMVYRIDTATALDGWGATTVTWAPWHEERPDITIRVINGTATPTVLTEADALESTVGRSDQLIYSDQRVLDLPIAAARVGSIVEELIVIREHRSLFDAGIVSRAFASHGAAFSVVRAGIVHPLTTSPPLLSVHALDGSYHASEAGGAMHHELVRYDTEGAGEYVPYLPYDVERYPYLAIATGAGWDDVGAAYAKTVESAIAGSTLTDLAAQIKGDERDERIRNATVLVQDRVRYTGLLLGENSILPATVSEVLGRGYGDCKDMATLLVGLLREIGVDASVALLLAGTGSDVPEDLPGLGLFNHAIVYVPGESGLWIDPTARHVDPLTIPPSDQNRRALIASPTASRLVRTVEFPSEATHIETTMRVELAGEGWGDLTSRTRFTGPVSGSVRSLHSYLSDEDARSDLEMDIESLFRFGEITEYTRSNADRGSEPFVVEWTLSDFGRANTSDTDAVAVVMPQLFVQSLPDLYNDGGSTPRNDPFYNPFPYVRTWTIEVTAPPEYVIRSLPDPLTARIGRGSLEVSTRQAGRSTAIISARIDTGDRNLTPSELEQAGRETRRLYEMEGLAIWFDHEGARLIADREYTRGLQVYRTTLEDAPEVPANHRRYSDALLKAGLRHAAEMVIREAIERAPEDASLHAQLGWVLAHDSVGRTYHPGWDREASIAAYRRSIELDPTNPDIWYALGSALEINATGIYRGAGADVAGATEAYRYMAEELGDTSALSEAIESAIVSGDRSEARRLLSLVVDSDTIAYLTFVLDILELDPSEIADRTRALGSDTLRRTVLSLAESLMVSMREYERAAEIIRLAARGTANVMTEGSRADLIESLAGAGQFSGSRVQRLGYDMLLGAFALPIDGGDLMRSTMTPEFFTASTAVTEGSSADFATMLESAIAGTGLDGPIVEDVLRTLIEVESSGTEHLGYIVTVSVDFLGSATELVLFADTLDGRPLLVASTDDLELLGAHIVRLADENRVPAAEFWLRRAIEVNDAIAGLLTPLGPIGRNAPDQRFAGVVLQAYAGNEAALKELASEPADTDDERTHLMIVQVDGYLAAGQPERARPLVQELYGALPDEQHIAWRYQRVLRDLRDWEALEEFIAAARSNPDLSLLATQAENGLADATGDVRRAERTLDTLIRADPNLAWMHLNSLAWLRLFTPDLNESALGYIAESLQRGGARSGAALHTAAAILARLDRPEDALAVLQSSLDADLRREPEPHDWLVLGYIAQSYGLEDIATDAFERVLDESTDSWTAFTSRELARRELSQP